MELQSIESVEKKQVFFIPNALSVNSNGEEYFFGSFLDRDLCYRMLTSMVMIAKSLNEITGESSTSRPTEEDGEDHDGNGDVSGGGDDNGAGDDDDTSDDEDGDGTDFDVNKLPNYLKLFETNSVSCVYQTSTSLPASMVWRHCWREKDHFMNFLTSVGDFDILATDWIPYTATPLTSSQDPLRLNYQYKRTVDYLHPRTSMLMFGPKNATAKQIQYLYLPELDLKKNNTSSSSSPLVDSKVTLKSTSTSTIHSLPIDDISSMKMIRNGCILTATQFEGIPMSDVFEVLQYWSFHKVSTEQTMISIGVTVNFLKGTLVRGQILAGTKEELSVLSKQWSDYSLQILNQIHETKARSKSTKNGKMSRSNSMMSLRRKSATEETMATTSASSTSGALNGQSVSVPSSTMNVGQPNDGGLGRTHLIIYLVLAVILLIQTLFLYLVYRQMTLLDHHVEEMKAILMSSIPSVTVTNTASGTLTGETLDPLSLIPQDNSPSSSCLGDCLNE
jgi:hypothetical protein